MVSSQFNSLSALGVYYFKFSYSGGWVSSFLICKVPDQLIVAHFFCCFGGESWRDFTSIFNRKV